MNLAPAAVDVILAAEKAKTDLVTFSFKTIMPMSIVALFFVAITHFFWQRYCDRREGLTQNADTALETAEAAALQSNRAAKQCAALLLHPAVSADHRPFRL